MDFKIVKIICMTFLLFFVIGAVSASGENTTLEQLNLNDKSEEIVCEEIIKYDSNEMTNDSSVSVSEKSDPDIYFNVPFEALVSDDKQIEITYNEYIGGKVNIYVDNELKYETMLKDDAYGHEYYVKINSLNLNYGKHDIELKYLENDVFNEYCEKTSMYYSYYSIGIDNEIIAEEDVENLIQIQLPPDAKATSTLYIDDKQVFKQKTSSEYMWVNINSLSFGEHTYNFKYSGDKKYSAFSQKGKFNYTYLFEVGDCEDNDIGRFNPIHSYNINYGDIFKTKVTLPDVIGDVIVIDGNQKYTFKTKDLLNISIPDLSVGYHNLIFTYSDKTHPKKTVNVDVNVTPVIKSSSMFLNENSTIYLKLPDDAQGQLVVFINDVQYASSNFENNIASIDLFNLTKYDRVTAKYVGDDYNVQDYECDTLSPFIVNIPNQIVYGENAYFTVKLADNANISLISRSELNYENLNFSDGIINISLLEPGTYFYNLDYEGDENYSPQYKSDFFTVSPNYLLPKFKVSFPNEIIAGTSTKLTLQGPSDFNAKYHRVFFNGNWYDANFKNGKASISVRAPNAGTNSFLLKIDSFDKYYMFKDAITLKILPKPKISAKNFKMNYLEGKYYKIRISDGNGKPVGKNEVVTFKIRNSNGKTYKQMTVKTDANGYAKFKVNFIPDDYDVKISYKGVSLTKSLKVKSIVFLHQFQIKKSAKKLILNMELSKVNGKYLKGKIMTLKFNGKTYKAKTNKKGEAQVIIKKSVLNKLKLGKIVNVKAIYQKDYFEAGVRVLK